MKNESHFEKCLRIAKNPTFSEDECKRFEFAGHDVVYPFYAGNALRGTIFVVVGICDGCKEENLPVLKMRREDELFHNGAICAQCIIEYVFPRMGVE